MTTASLQNYPVTTHRVKEVTDKISAEVGKVVVGKNEEVKMIVACLLAGGHALLQGVPGVAKTVIAKALANSLNLEFRRIQFTPDLLPSDIVGTFIFDQKVSDFKLRQGPIFANIILADEINRASPKTQSALLEAMQEKQVTVEGTTMKLPFPFMVLATQNPIEFEGTYQLPEAQIEGRDYVIPDDVKRVAPHVLPHRLVLSQEALLDGTTQASISSIIVNSVKAP